ncbi:MAG: hypothetical protein R2728_08835 [Chitinophagales bacterium]
MKTKIDKQKLLKRGWKELFWTFPAELFFALDNHKEPWTKLPHLHINYKVNRNLHSFTIKNEEGINSTLFKNGAWNIKQVEASKSSPLFKEIEFVLKSE